MLADPIQTTHPGSPTTTDFALVSLTGTESLRLATNSSEEEAESLRIRNGQSGKAGNIVIRRNMVLNHVWTDDAGVEKFASTSNTFSVSKGLGADGETVLFRQLCRFVSIVMPTLASSLDDITPSDTFKAWMRGEL